MSLSEMVASVSVSLNVSKNSNLSSVFFQDLPLVHIVVLSLVHLTKTRILMLQTVPRATWEDGGTKTVTLLIPMVFTHGAPQPLV